MNKQSEETSDDALSEEQRLQLLTRAGQRNRLVIFVLAGVLGSLMLLSAGLNLYGVLGAGDDSRVVALERQVARLEKQLAVQQVALSNQEELLASQQSRQLTGLFERAEHPDSIAQVSKVLQAQETDYQAVLQGLKVGMADLANMLPGSRSWLNLYNEPIDRALLNSRQRSEEIQAWAEQAAQAQP